MNNKLRTLVSILAVVLFVLFIAVLIITNKDEVEKASISVSTSDSSSENEAVAPQKSQFKEILFDTTPTMYGKTDYFAVEKGQEIKKMNMDYLQLEPLTNDDGFPQKYYLGHQIYKAQANGEEYIISGNAILPISFTADYEGNGYIREEETGKKIYLFGNLSDLENFLDNWEAGQRILSGKTEAPKNAIVFDGVLTPYEFSQKNGMMFFDLSEIAPLASEFTYYEETMGYIDVYVNDFCNVRIPTTAINPMMSKSLGVVGEKFKFLSWNGDKFEAWGPVLDAIHPEISVEDASMMFGWRMYTDGQALSIVTDPLNATPLTAIRNAGNMGIKVVTEVGTDGVKFICAYDSAGNQIWKKLFDETTLSAEDDGTA